MKKRLLVFLAVLLVLAACTPGALAYDVAAEQAEDFGTASLEYALPEQAYDAFGTLSVADAAQPQSLLAKLWAYVLHEGGGAVASAARNAALLLAVVFLLYQHEFAVQTIALTLAIASAVLLNHGSSSMPALVTAFCWAAMVLVAALLVLTVMLQKHEGSYKGTVIFPAKTNYALTCAVLVLSIAAIAVSLFAGLAYYVIWGAAVLLFVLAVWYTVKML